MKRSDRSNCRQKSTAEENLPSTTDQYVLKRELQTFLSLICAPKKAQKWLAPNVEMARPFWTGSGVSPSRF
jgi:hypothetical protein